MARSTCRVVHFLARFFNLGRAGIQSGQLRKGLDAGERSLLGSFTACVGLVFFLDAQHQQNDQNNGQQRSEQSGDNCNDDLLGSGLGHLDVRISHEKLSLEGGLQNPGL